MRIAVIDDTEALAADSADWAALDAETVFFPDAPLPALADFDVVVAMRERTRFTADVFAALPHLRLLVSTGLGTAHIDMAAAREHGVVVCGTPGASQPAAEITIALLMEMARGAGAEDAAVRAGRWGHSAGVTLAGRTLGIIGLGSIGRTVAAVAEALGMRVIAFSPRRGDDAPAPYVPRAEFFAAADVVSVHLKLTPETQGVVTAADLGRMRPSAWFINTARAALVEPGALESALTQGRIARAAVDVFPEEPLPPDSPWLAVPNLLLSGHRGYVTVDAFRAFYAGATEAIRAFRAGAPIRRLDT
ncbi:D-2-hydroxyacid dehydrogenase family protein [Microbacterium gorillae]|uniref:D-2-hydroxyacid dehydrogenase family protein n=1 Tax=Microbacterium gorillae TaxID=1231063 RepID=UPI0005906E27|nr:D-2-hydroxyacid dehydrogenase family protein [Microbacterium gorillae]